MKVYAYRNDINTVLKSSSGGAFLSIVQNFWDNALAEGKIPIVYGAKYDNELNVKHGSATELDKCLQFCGSKYVRSDLGDTFICVKNNLLQNMCVLFSGTPCQVKGLNNYLSVNNVDTTNLLCIDIICHGTPSPNIWRDYREWLSVRYHSKLVAFSFRYKGKLKDKKKRMKYPVMATFENGKVLYDTFLSRLYTNLFFTTLPLQESCYQCKYSNMQRVSDITIGDFWGYSDVMQNKDKSVDLGMSLVLSISDKGEYITNQLMKRANTDANIYMEECISDKYIEYQHNLNSPTEKPKLTETFREEYSKFGIEFVLQKYAGYNTKGKIKHIVKRLVTSMGLLSWVSKMRQNK